MHGRYFGGILSDRTLTPEADSRLGAMRFEAWLAQSAARAGQ